jgi:hypothetical protein
MVVEVVVRFVEENKVNICLYLVVDYLLRKDYYTVLMMMKDLMDKVVVHWEAVVVRWDTVVVHSDKV